MPDLPDARFPVTPGCAGTAAKTPVRRLVAENRLSPDDFIWPLFVIDGEKQKIPSIRCRACSAIHRMS